MDPWTPQRRWPLFALLAIALLIRLAHWWAVRDEPFFSWLAMDSQEYDRWAQGIANGDWLGSQVFFQAPLYPYALGLLYVVFGRSLDAVYLVQIALAVAGCWALYRAGRIMGGERVGLAAAGLAAFYGPFLFHDVQLLKESAAVAVVSFLLWSLAARRWFAAGVLLGILALLRENALLLLPFLLPLAASKGFLRRAGALIGGLLLALLPVAIRNGVVGGDFLPTTFQGGVNFYIGNNPEADGTYRPIVPGKQIPALERQEPVRIAESELGRKLSAGEVSSFWMRKALAWAADHPGDFLRLQLRKLRMFWSWYEWPDAVDYYWVRQLSPALRFAWVEFGAITLLALAGLWLVRRESGPFGPALLFALGWMLSTVVFFLFSRYRLPAVPALMILAAVPIARISERPRTGPVLAVLAALLIPHLIGFEPRLDLVHYNLGRIEDERGNPDAAREHYKAAFILNPRDFLACLNLGNHAARQGDWETALRFFLRAEALEPRSDDVQSNLGGVYLALGDFQEAKARFDRALALNPQNAAARHNREILERRLSASESSAGTPR
ncbi:MAG TPA: tetratricopeptide repeat protein [Thermoanaerobaculia bacterium]|jgi:tetratricopeptide (TPR) repeat protein|nr:tetratricopeptide repeat protein [Thermoanaerobaculia bacterium]